MSFTSPIEAAQILWDYMRLNQPLRKSDAIMVLGSYDTSAPIYAAELYHQGLAPIIITSGGVKHKWQDISLEDMTEAEAFAQLAIQNKVPKEKVLIENRATNSSENLWFSEELMHKNGYAINSAILIQKPSSERRAYAMAKMRWPDKEFCVTSRPIAMRDYISMIDERRAICSMVGDVQWMEVYRDTYLVGEEIPDYVWSAFYYLTENGFTDRLAEPYEQTLARIGYINGGTR